MSQTSDHGEPLRYDPDFKGPLAKRSCTDVLCLLLFLVFLAGWVVIGVYAIKTGDLNRLVVPTDTEGRKCGVDADVLNKPYLFFFDLMRCASPAVPITGCPTPQICVEECPQENFVYSSFESIDIARQKLICKPDVNKNQIKSHADVDRLISNNKCARWYLKSEKLLNRCISELLPSECPPKKMECENKNKNGHKMLERKMNILDTWLHKIVSNIVVRITNDNSANQIGTRIVEDLVVSWWQIVIGLIASMLLCLCYIGLMRWIAAPMVWFSIIGVIAILGYGSYLCFAMYVFLKNNPVEKRSYSISLSGTFEEYFDKKETYLWLGIVLAVILLIILLTIIFLRKRVVIAIALIEEGSKAVSAVTTTLVFPIFPWILQSLIIAYAIVIGLHLAGVGEPYFKVNGLTGNMNCICKTYKDNDTCTPEFFNIDCRTSTNAACTDATCHFLGIENPTFITYFHVINVFGFFWCIFFVSGLGEMILAATFATWYWTFNKAEVPFFALTVSISRTVRYHLGTLAFGSLIIAICRMIRVALEYIDQKLKKYDNAFVKAILCCMKCFFFCLERFLKFINRNAYIMCAIHGKNFCASARDAFSLLMRNVLRVFVLDKVTDFLFFLSKVLISGLMGVLAYTFFHSKYVEGNLNYSIIPVVVIVIGAYLISCIFFGVYAMAVDTLFLCFLEDCERNDGSADKPYYMSKNLMSILGKKNKRE